jgi:hypothetical protein
MANTQSTDIVPSRASLHRLPRLSLKDNTAGVREREDANRTREAGNRDEVEGVVANTPRLHWNGAVGGIDGLGLSGRFSLTVR